MRHQLEDEVEDQLPKAEELIYRSALIKTEKELVRTGNENEVGDGGYGRSVAAAREEDVYDGVRILS
ncbi:hypothetical protein P7K49_029044 [Saguinus oedipus]|uniref:Uncharacterized protein n=1 Tax=Saguinus oedipus TaxID=9490 RepID=A0ABQ9U637_SAGOE|nr:hypothetical protein P7K49_029044 [Saguinus oedipus]